MLALYRSERQAEALEVYRDARRTLVEELGIEPGERLRELERAILAQDPSLRAEPAAAQAAPRSEAPRGAFVGRERELAELLGGLDDARRPGRLVLVAGEPGIGKSRLAEELSRTPRARGARVLVGRCWEAGGAPAYWPWVQSLRAYVRRADAETLRAQLGAGAADAGAAPARAARAACPTCRQPPALESEGARFRLFDAVAAFLRSAAAARRSCSCSTTSTPPTSRRCCCSSSSRARSRTAACWSSAPTATSTRPCAIRCASALAELAREPRHAADLRSRGLTEPDVGRVHRARPPSSSRDPARRRDPRRTEGNPLFVDEVVRLLAAEGALAAADARSPCASRRASAT